MANFRTSFPIGDEPFGSFTMSMQPGYIQTDVCNFPLVIPFLPHGGIKLDPKLRLLSTKGQSFIFKHEAMKNVTNHLHWPGGASGVTLGPGYDMKARTAASITADMKAIGLSDAVAKIVSQASTLVDAAADKFARDHKSAVDLSDKQQKDLLTHVVKPYEHRVRRSLKVPLTQYEFDALVSFAYNPGRGWHTVTHRINARDIKGAMKEIRACNVSRKKILLGLTHRRADEVKLFLEGKYEFNGQVIA